MSTYQAPLKDMRFALNELAGLGEVAKLPGYADATPDTVDAILEEASKFASGILDPINYSGDQEGSKWADGAVRTPKGFREAYKQFCEGGWNALPFEAEWGGQGLPRLVSTPVQEMWKSSNMSFSLCPLLTQGAIEALLLRGAPELQRRYLPKMVEGHWTGTMNLTEPQAGSDLSLVRTRAERQGDHFLISGQKIFITYGEHDMSENIVHLVLARTPEAPEGVKGISLFVVPKFMPNADGTLGKRNGAKCASIEHKLGIHASPTAVMVYDKAVGYVVGEENRGLEYMFIMMNAARFAVGLEGVAIAERAFQRALAFAKERVQGRDLVQGAQGTNAAVPIIRHPDVRRMLMLMKSQTEAMRALAYTTAAAMDYAHKHPDAEARKQHQAFVDLMIPVVKGWSTETGIEVASLGVQVHGAAQYLRDARITTIYEGTTGIQAMDLVGRKIAREAGATAKAWLASLKALDAELGRSGNADIKALRAQLAQGAQAVADGVNYIVETKDPRAIFAGAVPFLKLMGIVAGGWQMARAALAAEKKLASGDRPFLEAKISTARFYGDQVLVQAPALRDTVVKGSPAVMALSEEQFLAA